MSTDATTDGRTTDDPQTEEAADSAAERLGGPSETEERLDRTSEEETGARRQADTANMTTDTDTTRGAEVASEADADALRQGDAGQGDADQGVVGGADTPRETQRGARREETGEGQQATLIPPDRAESYNSRWNELKGEFVDEPSKAVRGANELVGEVLDELEELFRSQRAELEKGLDSEQTTTEDLRQALGRYRSFFDRLLSF